MKLGSNAIRPAIRLPALLSALLLALISVLLMALVLGGLVGGILLRTDAVQKRIGEAFSSGTGMVVKFESFSAGFWSARLKNLTASDQEGDALSTKEVYAKLELLPLLTGRLVFREIRLNGVRLVRIEASRVAAAEEPVRVPVDAAADSERKKREANRVVFLRALRSLQVSDAAVDWQLADGRTKLQLEGVDLQVRMDAHGGGGGEVSILQGSWMEMVRFKDVRSGLRLHDGVLEAEGLEAACGEGLVKGAAQLALEPPQMFSCRVEATDVDLEKMSAELPTLRIAGKARAAFQMQGAASEDASWTGTAKLEVEEGKFKGISLFQMLGQIFQIQELSNFRVRQGLVSLRIAEKKIWLDELHIDGGDLALSAPGTVDFRRNLALNAKLVVPERLLNGRVAQMLSNGFSAPDAAGLRSIVFQVGGTLDKPSTNLMEKAVGEGLGGIVNQLLGGFLKPKKAEKTENTDATEAATGVPK